MIFNNTIDQLYSHSHVGFADIEVLRFLTANLLYKARICLDKDHPIDKTLYRMIDDFACFVESYLRGSIDIEELGEFLDELDFTNHLYSLEHSGGFYQRNPKYNLIYVV